MKIDRLLTITIMLLNRTSITAKELSEKFEVSIRTIYRDIDTISMTGIPIVSFPGRSGGYCIMENYKLNHQLLSLKEISAILTALRGVNASLMDQQLESSIEKIRTMLPYKEDAEKPFSSEEMVIDLMPWGGQDQQRKNLKIIQKGIQESQCLDIFYRNSIGEKLQRIIEPMTLIFRGFGWYLFAYCQKKRDYRLFRISRISTLKILNSTFSRKNTSFREHVEFGQKPQNEVDIILKFSGQVRALVEDFYDENKIQYLSDGSLLVTTKFPEGSWIYSNILSYGDQVEVIEPPHIRDKIREKALNMVKKYKH